MRSLIVFTAICLSAGSAWAISMTDYQVPVSRSTSALAEFRYNYAHDRGTTADNGTVRLDFNQFYSSLPTGYRLAFNGQVNRDGLTPEGKDKFTYSVSALAQGNKYLSEESNAFGFGKTEGIDMTAYDRPGFALTLGVGYGRFINATPLARALRAEEELFKEDLLTGEIPDNIMLDVAKRMASQVIDKYKQEYDYWERYYFGDLEKEFQKSDRLRDKELGGVGTLVVRDVVEEIISERYYGYELSGGIRYDLQTPDENTDRQASLEINANFAYPFNLRSQFVEYFRINSPLTGKKFGEEVHLSFTPAYSYEIGNTLDFTASYKLVGDQLDVEGSKMEFYHLLTVTASYYIANRIDIGNSITLSKPSTVDKVATQFSTGFKLRLR